MAIEFIILILLALQRASTECHQKCYYWQVLLFSKITESLFLEIQGEIENA